MARPSVMFVFAKQKRPSSGTGFAVHMNGLLVTALHVVDEAQEITVALPTGQSATADVLAADVAADIALLRVSQTLVPLKLGDSDALRVGEEIAVIGYPLADVMGTYDVTATRGIVSAIRSQLGRIQVDAAMNPGVSGGPVFNQKGEVVGVAVSKLRGAEGVNFAAPINAVRSIVSRHLQDAGTQLPVRLPLTKVQSIELGLSGGPIGGGVSKEELGVSCTQPEQGTKAIVEIRGELDRGTYAPLLTVVWLSWKAGAPIQDQSSFAFLDGTRGRRLVSVRLKDLRLAPEVICINYRAANRSLLPVGATFRAKYDIDQLVTSIER